MSACCLLTFLFRTGIGLFFVLNYFLTTFFIHLVGSYNFVIFTQYDILVFSFAKLVHLKVFVYFFLVCKRQFFFNRQFFCLTRIKTKFDFLLCCHENSI